MKLQKTAIHEQTTTQLAASFNSPKVRLEENGIDRLFFFLWHELNFQIVFWVIFLAIYKSYHSPKLMKQDLPTSDTYVKNMKIWEREEKFKNSFPTVLKEFPEITLCGNEL